MKSFTRLKNILDNLYTDDILLALSNIMTGEICSIYKYRTTFGYVIDDLRSKKILKKSGQLLLCEYYTDDFNRMQYPCTCLYNIGSLKKEFNSNSLLRTLKIDDINKNEYQKYLHLHDVPVSYALDFIPRQEILSFHVNIDNVNLIKPEVFMACIIDDITYYGISESEVEYEKSHLCHSSLKMPLNNGSGHNCLFPICDEDFSTISEDDTYTSYECLLTNKINEYNMVYNYWYKPYKKYLKSKSEKD